MRNCNNMTKRRGVTSDDHATLHDAVERAHTGAKAPTHGTRLAGYTDAQLSTVPEGVSFFGCGNPLAYAEVKPGDTVLDLGCGAGLDLILAGQAVGPGGRVIGLDMSAEMVSRARANVARAGLANVDVRECLIESMPVPDASTDWVISNCVLSLSPDKERVFGEIARVLRPGGRMMISDVVVDAPVAWLLRRLEWIAPSIAMARDEALYLQAMARAGLVDITVLDRLIYETTDLIGLFADELTPKITSRFLLPVQRLVRGSLELSARFIAGHVWSSKIRARRPC